MHYVGPMSKLIWWMGSGNNSTTDGSQGLQFSNAKGAYQSTNNITLIQQIPNYYYKYTSLVHVKKILSSFAIEWY